MDGDLVALHDPLDGGLAVDDVVVGAGGDAFEADAAVVEDGAFLALLGEAHLLDVVVGVELVLGAAAEFRVPVDDLDGGAGWNRFVADVELGEGVAGLAEFPEVGGLLYEWEAGEHLLEVGGVGFAVLRAVEEAIDVVKDVLLGDLFAVSLVGLVEDPIADAVLADVFGGAVVAVKEGG